MLLLVTPSNKFLSEPVPEPGSLTPIPVWTLPPRFRSEQKSPIRSILKMHNRIRSPLWFPNSLLIWGILCILWFLPVLYLFGTTMGFWIAFQICQQLGEEMYHWIAWRTIVREYTANFFEVSVPQLSLSRLCQLLLLNAYLQIPPQIRVDHKWRCYLKPTIFTFLDWRTLKCSVRKLQ